MKGTKHVRASEKLHGTLRDDDDGSANSVSFLLVTLTSPVKSINSINQMKVCLLFIRLQALPMHASVAFINL